MAFYNDYESLGDAGKGANARVFKVRHLQYGYIRALKVLNGSIIDEQDKAYQTFLKECKILLKIGNGCHPNIVRIFQPRLIQNQATVEMDYVNGINLDQYLEENKYMTIDEVYKFISQIGGALAYCHHDIYLDQLNWDEDDLQPDPNDGRIPLIDAKKRRELIKKYRIIHNDLHSGNVMRRNHDGNFFLLDFGLAIQNGSAVKSSSRMEGAPEYKAPEKWKGVNVETTQNDIYSFGVLMYEVLTGQTPFPINKEEYNSNLREKSIVDVMNKHLYEEPSSIKLKRRANFELVNPDEEWHRDYPEWLDQIVMKCLAKDPLNRYVDAKELMDDFNRHLAEDKSTMSIMADDGELNELQAKLNQAQSTILGLQSKCNNLEAEINKLKSAPPNKHDDDKDWSLIKYFKIILISF